MSRNMSFIFDHPIICKTVIVIDQSDNSAWCVLDFDSKRFQRHIAVWFVNNMNPDVTPHRMSLDVTGASQKKEKQYTTDIKILIKLCAERIRPFSSERKYGMADLLEDSFCIYTMI